jgi:hypothetical protein
MPVAMSVTAAGTAGRGLVILSFERFTFPRVDVDELLAKAWAAVEGAGIPGPLQAVALKEAIDFLRAGDGAASASSSAPVPSSSSSSGGSGRASRRSSRRDASSDKTGPVDQAAVFAALADESGVSKADIEDVLQVRPDGTISVTAPTKDLGANVAEQARNIVALVASARAIGRGESPVNAEAVRQELARKRAYQQNNFSGHHLRPMKGFNAGSSRSEIVLTSKWVDEFKAAIDKVHGRAPSGNKP